MKKLPILACLMVVAAAAFWLSGVPQYVRAQVEKTEKKDKSAIKPTSGSAAKATLERARNKLNSYRTITARLRQTVSIGNRRVRAVGTYRQQRLKLRVEYKLTVGSGDNSLSGSLLEVCDGEVLWTQHKIGKKTRITQRNVLEILNAARSNSQVPENAVKAQLGLGGLGALLASLGEFMVFDVVKDEQIDGKPFLLIEGTWNKKFLDQWNKKSLDQMKQANPKSPQPLPSYVPDRVRIYFHRDDLFPRRILYLKQPPARKFFRPMVKLDFTDIQLNSAIDEEEFNFLPPDNVIPVDITNAYTEQLKSPPPPVQTSPEAR